MRIYGVALSFNNGQELMQLPINPESIEVSEEGNSKSYDISEYGEINVLLNRKLTVYKMKSLFPAHSYPFQAVDFLPKLKEDEDKDKEKNEKNSKESGGKRLDQSNIQEPIVYIKMLESWMKTKRPIRFLLQSDTYDINTAASIESFDWREIAGSGGDIEYELQLRKYAFYGAKRLKPAKKPGEFTSKVSRPNEKQPAKTYTLVAGDSLWTVAKKQLGDATRWSELQKLNGIKEAEITKLQIGRVLMLP